MPITDLENLLDNLQSSPQRRRKPRPVTEPTETPSLIERSKETLEETLQLGRETGERKIAGEISEPEAVFQILGQSLKGVGDVAADAVITGLSKIPGAETIASGIKDLAKTGIKFNVGNILQDIAQGQPLGTTGEEQTGEGLENLRLLNERFEATEPNIKANIRASLGFLDVILAATGFKPAVRGARAVEEVAETGIRKGVQKVKSLFTKPVKSVDELIAEADKTFRQFEAAAPGAPAAIREAAEEAAPKLTIKEKFAGVRPDVKKRIQGKQEQLKEFFDVANARNLDDTLPTPLDHAAQKVTTARDELQAVLSDKGNKIGKFREKIATFKVEVDDVDSITSTFDDALKPLNLTVDKAGNVTREAGKVAGKVSDSEIKLLQGLREDIQVIKQSPEVENLIDLRNAFDERINFAKSAKEASNVVDPISRKVRSTIRDVNLNIIGKEQGKLLADFSDLSDLLKELNKFVDRKSGGEFLLKRVLSERGRVPREILQKLKEVTGIDLMDDAVMAQLATELIGNTAQKGLFRQEITKAGLDAESILGILSGRPDAALGGARTLLEKGKEAFAPVEKTFLEAAK